MKKVIFAVMLLCLIPSVAQAEGYYFHYDHLGSVDVVTNEEGEVVAEYDYLPFGEVYEETIYDEDFSNSYEFTGQESDDETGLYYYGARYYGAGVSRFMSQDPAVYDERVFEMLQDPQLFNAYAYVRNNPVKYVDPNGEEPIGYAFWGGVGVPWLKLHDCKVAASFLQYSIQGNQWLGYPFKNKETVKFSNHDEIGTALMTSKGYSEDILGDIKNNIANGIYKNDSSYEFNQYSEDQDMYLAFGKISYSFVANLQDDGSYKVSIQIYDTYDFNLKDYEGDILAKLANNLGWASQYTGDLSSFKIEGYITDNITLNSDE